MRHLSHGLFFTTHVCSPNEDVWGKLKRILKYLNGTQRLKLTFTVDNLSHLKWYIDGLHQTHDNCRGHTGGLLILGCGAITSTSKKQKMNTMSSTKAELVAVYNKLGDILWMLYFIKAQGDTLDQNIIYQDNLSTLSLEKNGHISGSHHTKHIKAQFFLIKDKAATNKVTLNYCPTEEMWPDVLTKPHQGRRPC